MWLAKKRCPTLDNWGWYLANDARGLAYLRDGLWKSETKRLRRKYTPVTLGRGPIVPMDALDMTIKAADVRKRIGELEQA